MDSRFVLLSTSLGLLPTEELQADRDREVVVEDSPMNLRHDVVQSLGTGSRREDVPRNVRLANGIMAALTEAPN